jgi:hypothetical protein
MPKQQIRGVEKLAGQTQSFTALSPSVDGIATDGVSDRGKMRTDLMGPTCDQPDPQKGGPRQLLLDLEVGHGVARLVRACRHDRP